MGRYCSGGRLRYLLDFLAFVWSYVARYLTPRRYPGEGGTSYISIRGVRMEGKIQTQKQGFPENFAPRNMGKIVF